MKKIKRVEQTQKEKITLELPSFGLGILRTSTTYASLIIQLEGDRQDQISVFDSVMQSLNIHPEEIIHARKQPDCVQEEKYRKWNKERKELEKKLGVS